MTQRPLFAFFARHLQARIIHRHGGEIVATASPGQAATFCFALPGEEKAES